MSDQAARVRQIAAVVGQGHRIAKAIDWLKLNYAQPLLEWLRLSEAKRLTLRRRRDQMRRVIGFGSQASVTCFSSRLRRRQLPVQRCLRATAAGFIDPF